MTSPRRTPRGFLRLGKPEERVPFGDLTNVKDRLLARGIKPRKKWGQSFLTRPETAQRIVEEDPVIAGGYARAELRPFRVSLLRGRD